MPGKVVIDGRGLQPGFKSHHQRGIGRYARNLIQALVDIAPERFVIAWQKGLAAPEIPHGAELLALPALTTSIPFGRRLINQHILAAMRLAGRKSGDMPVHYLSHLDAPAMAGGPSIITVHDLIFQRLEGLYKETSSNLAAYRVKRWLETRALFHTKRIIAVSDQTKRDIIELYGFPDHMIRVIPEAADPGLMPLKDADAATDIMRGHGLDPERCFFLYLGGLDQRKGLDVLLDAMAGLKDKGRDCDLVIAGSLSDHTRRRALEIMIETRKVTERVHLTGFVPDHELPALFASCLAFVFPSLYEGFGLPPLEAMVCGAPVIAADTSAVPEVVGKAGILIPPGDAAALTQAMAAIMDRPDLASRLRERGLKRAAGFSWQRTARETLSVYDEVIFDQSSG